MKLLTAAGIVVILLATMHTNSQRWDRDVRQAEINMITGAR